MKKRSSSDVGDDYKVDLAVKEEVLIAAEAIALRQSKGPRLQDMIGFNHLAGGADVLGIATEMLDDLFSQDFMVVKAQLNLIKLGRDVVGEEETDLVATVEHGREQEEGDPAAVKCEGGDTDVQSYPQIDNVSPLQAVLEVFDEMSVQNDGATEPQFGDAHLLGSARYMEPIGRVLAAARDAVPNQVASRAVGADQMSDGQQNWEAAMRGISLNAMDSVATDGAEGEVVAQRDLRLDGLSVGTIQGSEQLATIMVSVPSLVVQTGCNVDDPPSLADQQGERPPTTIAPLPDEVDDTH